MDLPESAELVGALIVDVYMVLTNQVKVFGFLLDPGHSIEQEDIRCL